MTYSGADRLRQLGAIMLAAESLDRALNDLSRTELRCLADMAGASVTPSTSAADLQVRVRRRLLNLKGSPNGNRQPPGQRGVATSPESPETRQSTVTTTQAPVKRYGTRQAPAQVVAQANSNAPADGST